jgi:hypothetical protein
MRLSLLVRIVSALALTACASSAPQREAPVADVDLDAKKTAPSRTGARAAELDSAIAEPELQMLSKLDGAGVSTESVLDRSEIPPGLLQEAAGAAGQAGGGGIGGLSIGSGSPPWAARGTTGGSALDPSVPIPKGPDSEVRMGAAEVRGGTVENAPAVVAGMRASFRRCHVVALREDPTLAGKIEVVATLDANGEVKSVREASGDKLGKVNDCVKASAMYRKFSPPADTKGNVEVVIRATFIIK